MPAFQDAFATIAATIHDACQVNVIWKDSDPRQWATWPRQLSQHRNPYCIGVKNDPQRLAVCCRTDTAAPTGDAATAQVCPFGVAEIIVPVHVGSDLLGWCFVGSWRKAAKTPPSPCKDIAQAWRQLPIWNATQAQACGELVRRLVGGIAHLRPGSLNSHNPRLAEVDHFIEQRLAATLTARDIAAHIDLSPSRFVHWFKEITGETISQHLKQRLMTRAAKRLMNDQLAVTTLAMDLGYGSPAAFSTAFKRYFGLSPARWRSQIAITGE